MEECVSVQSFQSDFAHSEFATGMVVFSKAGHDKNLFYILTSCKGGVGFIANGKRRKLLKPKRKNLAHLSCTKTVFDMATIDSDKKIRRILQQFNGAVSVTE